MLDNDGILPTPGNGSQEIIKLTKKIKDKSAVIGVVGLGYVGLPLAVEKAKVGFSVVGFDRNPNRVAQINRGENYIKDVNDDELRQIVDASLLVATTDFTRLSSVDIVVICVPTPLTATRDPDITYNFRKHNIPRHYG